MLHKHEELLRLGRLLGLGSCADQHRITELLARAIVRSSDAPQQGTRACTITEAAPLVTKLMLAGWGGVWDLCERLSTEEVHVVVYICVRVFALVRS